MTDVATARIPEQSSGPFNPEIILPTQFFKASSAHTGERRLLVALLEDAIGCFQKNAYKSNRRGRRLFGEVDRWFTSVDRRHVYAFENVCDFLQLDADAIRVRLRGWAQAAVATAEDRSEPDCKTQRQPAKKASAAASARAGFTSTSSQAYDIGLRTNLTRVSVIGGAAGASHRTPKSHTQSPKKREVS